MPFFLLVVPIFFLMRFWPLAGGNDMLGQGGNGLLGGYAALILPFSVSWYGIFLMRQFMLASRRAARRGAHRRRVGGSASCPHRAAVDAPGAATLGIFVFVYQWNEIIWTMTVTRSAAGLQTVPVGIYLIRGAFDDIDQQSLQQAAIVVSTLPVVLLFLAPAAPFRARDALCRHQG